MMDKPVRINTAVIVGVGLIGGSLAGAWRESGFAARIVGVEPNRGFAEQALSMGLVDEIVSVAPPGADLIAICTPSDQIAQQIADYADHGAALFDVGSVKGPIIASLAAQGDLPARFVPCHPISGSEQSGPKAARADLFAKTVTVITPTKNTDRQAQVMVEAAWRATGAELATLDADAHDAMLAVTSHLPHLLAFAFMQQVETSQLPFSGGGFRDFTRIAAANPELWWRILGMNKAQVLAATQRFQDDLGSLVLALEQDDVAAGTAMLQAAGARRQELDT